MSRHPTLACFASVGRFCAADQDGGRRSAVATADEPAPVRDGSPPEAADCGDVCITAAQLCGVCVCPRREFVCFCVLRWVACIPRRVLYRFGIILEFGAFKKNARFACTKTATPLRSLLQAPVGGSGCITDSFALT